MRRGDLPRQSTSTDNQSTPALGTTSRNKPLPMETGGPVAGKGRRKGQTVASRLSRGGSNHPPVDVQSRYQRSLATVENEDCIRRLHDAQFIGLGLLGNAKDFSLVSPGELESSLYDPNRYVPRPSTTIELQSSESRDVTSTIPDDAFREASPPQQATPRLHEPLSPPDSRSGSPLQQDDPRLAFDSSSDDPEKPRHCSSSGQQSPRAPLTVAASLHDVDESGEAVVDNPSPDDRYMPRLSTIDRQDSFRRDSTVSECTERGIAALAAWQPSSDSDVSQPSPASQQEFVRESVEEDSQSAKEGLEEPSSNRPSTPPRRGFPCTLKDTKMSREQSSPRQPLEAPSRSDDTGEPALPTLDRRCSSPPRPRGFPSALCDPNRTLHDGEPRRTSSPGHGGNWDRLGRTHRDASTPLTFEQGFGRSSRAPRLETTGYGPARRPIVAPRRERSPPNQRSFFEVPAPDSDDERRRSPHRMSPPPKDSCEYIGFGIHDWPRHPPARTKDDYRGHTDTSTRNNSDGRKDSGHSSGGQNMSSESEKARESKHGATRTVGFTREGLTLRGRLRRDSFPPVDENGVSIGPLFPPNRVPVDEFIGFVPVDSEAVRTRPREFKSIYDVEALYNNNTPPCVKKAEWWAKNQPSASSRRRGRRRGPKTNGFGAGTGTTDFGVGFGTGFEDPSPDTRRFDAFGTGFGDPFAKEETPKEEDEWAYDYRTDPNLMRAASPVQQLAADLDSIDISRRPSERTTRKGSTGDSGNGSRRSSHSCSADCSRPVCTVKLLERERLNIEAIEMAYIIVQLECDEPVEAEKECWEEFMRKRWMVQEKAVREHNNRHHFLEHDDSEHFRVFGEQKPTDHDNNKLRTRIARWLVQNSSIDTMKLRGNKKRLPWSTIQYADYTRE